ncbi:MAG: hypothetical protein ACRDLP_03940 [Solirubrobacteraceae bacterium]
MQQAARGLAASAAIGGLTALLALWPGVGVASPRPGAPSRARALPRGFRWFAPAQAPAAWKRSSLPSGGAILSYPASLSPVRSDSVSIAFGRTDSSGRILVYLNATPKQAAEHLATWPTFRIAHNRLESKDVHEDASAFGLTFIGGSGSCVIDDYVTRGVHSNHYREIACFVRGSTTSSVVVAAALGSQWKRNARLLERAVDSYQLS